MEPLEQRSAGRLGFLRDLINCLFGKCLLSGVFLYAEWSAEYLAAPATASKGRGHDGWLCLVSSGSGMKYPNSMTLCLGFLLRNLGHPAWSAFGA